MNVIKKAKEVREERESSYGNCIEDFKKTSKLASIITGKELTEEDCVNVLIAVKLSRQSNKHKEDNLVDLIGYIDILDKVIENNLESK